LQRGKTVRFFRTAALIKQLNEVQKRVEITLRIPWGDAAKTSLQ